MDHAKFARPLGPDDIGRKHFVFFCPVIYSFADPVIDTIHSWFFQCHASCRRADEYPRWGDRHLPISVTKNVYNLTQIFVDRVDIVVNRQVRDLLSLCTTVEFQDVTINSAFFFPYAPGDRSYELAGINTDGSPESVMARFAATYGCEPPSETYYEVVAYNRDRVVNKWADTRQLRVGKDISNKTSVHVRDVAVSPSMLEKHGLVFERGYICRPDVFEIINPYLHRPWFWMQRYLLE